MRAIISGFEPTWGIKRTPSGDFAKLWQDGSLTIPGVETRGVVLPQVFGKSTEILIGEIATFKPNIVLMFGATQHNDPLRLERFAINCEKTTMGDNTRIPVKERSIVIGGPPAYEPTIPVHWLLDNLKNADIDCKASYFAGTHTCNSLMYGVLHWIANNPLTCPDGRVHPIAAGFFHVPFPNEYGVIEDELWTTATFDGIVLAGKTLLEQTILWYAQTYGIK